MDAGKYDQLANKAEVHYNRRASSYEEELQAKGYQGPVTAARALAGVLTEDRKGKVILDIGGGTGLVGVELVKEGFETIDILDPAEMMLAVARQKRIYRNVITSTVNGLNSTPLKRDSYDAVLCVGVICMAGPGFTCPDLEEVIRVAKPGGIIVMTLRTETLYSNLYRDKLLPFCDKLQADGAWKLLERSKFDYMHGVEGQLFIYQKL
ncbi:uncharacterized protein LOC117339633 isoform X2 [Pecten maximus]|uniref:uncharacterized protein LOC117339633 isoform X2 n=1 Tax=Pecten maximus TaxID=6579 RepID=UPI0014585577|nr:uncharacterized protein LOC117339633 isoform X2 [Pecten maximus]